MQNQNIKSYAGFTIGPIYDVMRHSKKTRELWFGSYFFSWYMEMLISKLIGGDVFFLVPDISNIASIPKTLAGKYNDRFVLSSPSLSSKELYDKILQANDCTLNFFVELIHDFAKDDTKTVLCDGNNIGQILKGYLQTRFFAINAEKIEKKSAVKEIYGYLDSMEESFIFTPGKSVKTCEICKTLPRVVKITEQKNEAITTQRLCPLCFLKRRAVYMKKLLDRLNEKPDNRGRFYPSLQEISANEIFEDKRIQEKLNQRNFEDVSFEELADIIKEVNKESGSDAVPLVLRPFHKYLVIIQADGDNLSKYVKKTESDSCELSKFLFKFTEEAEGLVKKYGGVPVFLGGDDILAFMPVYYDKKTVIDFIDEVSKTYKNIIGQNQKGMSISFGVNISYHKFPLSTALEKGRNLLEEAKNKGKDSVAFCLTKHSGSQTTFMLKISDHELELVNNVVAALLDDEIKIPRGIYYNLSRFKCLLANIPDEPRLCAFFENNFNEIAHEKFAEGLHNNIVELFSYYLFNKKSGSAEESVETVLNILKFIRFLTVEKS